MNWHHLARRAYEMDLEEIFIMAQVARPSPPYVAHQMLMMITHEVMDAMHWLMVITMGISHDYYKPPFGSPFTTEEKTEGKSKI